jgi:hypothetical protein
MARRCRKAVVTPYPTSVAITRPRQRHRRRHAPGQECGRIPLVVAAAGTRHDSPRLGEGRRDRLPGRRRHPHREVQPRRGTPEDRRRQLRLACPPIAGHDLRHDRRNARPPRTLHGRCQGRAILKGIRQQRGTPNPHWPWHWNCAQAGAGPDLHQVRLAILGTHCRLLWSRVHRPFLSRPSARSSTDAAPQPIDH